MIFTLLWTTQSDQLYYILMNCHVTFSVWIGFPHYLLCFQSHKISPRMALKLYLFKSTFPRNLKPLHHSLFFGYF